MYGRFSGGTSGLSIGHASPEAAEGGAIGLIEEGDSIEIDIPNRSINLAVSDDVLATRRAMMNAKGNDAWKPVGRERVVSQALQASVRFLLTGVFQAAHPGSPLGTHLLKRQKVVRLA